MTYINEFDKTGDCGKDGERAEKNFERIFTARFGVKPIKATEYQNKVEHIDYFMQVKGHNASVDVKSWKHDAENFIIEFVSYGKLGWLYGKADYIAFETPDEQNFMMFKREELVMLVKRLCVVWFTQDRHEMLYRLYVRHKERNGVHYYDCITKLPRQEVCEMLNYWLLDKGKDE